MTKYNKNGSVAVRCGNVQLDRAGHFTLKSFRRNERETKQQRNVELWIYSQVGCQVTST